MRRRRFLGWLAAAAALGAPLLRAVARLAPRRFRRACAAPRYPGSVRPLDLRSIERPGRWRG